ncbi:MFS transporter [Novosphingobium sp.]|uniref:MFS transporter n=1 Tax=Novosphingobium sp. TaxID=1874826 RepID=UPI0035AF8215
MSLTPQASEWQLGWRIVAGAAIANATGISLVFYTFSMFLIPMAQELHLTRGQTGMVQALIITAALGAPLIGRLADLFGFHRVFIGATVIMTVIELTQAKLMDSLTMLAITVALSGIVGGGASAVLLTRPVSAHFRRHRGMALGIVGAGASISTIFVPPILQQVIDAWGWRQGFFTLAMIAFALGMPLVLALMPRGAAMAAAAQPLTGGAGGKNDSSFLKVRDFWLLVGSNFVAAMAISGAISQLSPMIQDKGLSAATAALGLSAFAAGQFVGKIGGGWLLDKLEPRLVALTLLILPSFGFVLFLGEQGVAAAALAACALLGILQGADMGIFAYFIARRFGPARYGTVFGALHGIGWIGTALGIVGFGLTFDHFGSYAPIQIASIGLLVLAALLFIPIRLDAEEADEPTVS